MLSVCDTYIQYNATKIEDGTTTRSTRWRDECLGEEEYNNIIFIRNGMEWDGTERNIGRIMTKEKRKGKGKERKERNQKQYCTVLYCTV
jgi:hypothetical protein